jgi:hypothetical protein
MGNIDNVRKLKSRCKLFYYGENLDRFPPYNNDDLIQSVFDLIVGFKETDALKKQVRFPLWLMYYEFYSYNERNNILKYIQQRYDENMKSTKTKFATMVSSHDLGGQRAKIFNELSKFGAIESPGKFKKNVNNIGNTIKDKIDFVSKGLINICPENSKGVGYFTEKIFHAFEGGTIPIYWGIDFPENEIINKNKVCFYDERFPNIISDMIDNPKSYIQGSLFTEDAGIHINLFYTSLIENIRIHLKLM